MLSVHDLMDCKIDTIIFPSKISHLILYSLNQQNPVQTSNPVLL
jgi:hypothetical protein